MPSMFSYLNPLPSLPQYAGPYKVAVTDYEIPVSEISSSTTAAPDLEISTIKFRIYYPTPSTEVARESVYWLPNPQKQWNEAFASFLGVPSKWTSVASKLWSVTNYAKLPVIKNASLLLPDSKSGIHPVCFFSHGLGGNTNIYSSIVGSLASCGVVTIVPEHRDGSCPISFIRNAQGGVERTIPYQKLSHSPDAKVLNARNAQLRIRLWELELTYTVVKAMNQGKTFTNHADDKREPPLKLDGQLNFAPGSVTWAGHSFGAATVTQFVKSIFHHRNLPEPKEASNNDKEWDWTPLYQTKSGSDLVQQITPESPVILLDIWTMPLRGESTSWLWELPMPCYSRESTSNGKPNTVAIVSGEFYRYKGILDRTRALLSRSPAQAIQLIESGAESKNRDLPPDVEPNQGDVSISSSSFLPDLSKQEPASSTTNQAAATKSATPSSNSSRDPSPIPKAMDSDLPTPTSSQSSLSLPHTNDTKSSPTPPQLYHIPHSAHLSQSDFGLLFPNLTRYAMKALDPHKTIEMNVRAILAVMQGRGLPVQSLVERSGKRDANDYIFEDTEVDKDASLDVKERERRTKERERWVKVPLVD